MSDLDDAAAEVAGYLPMLEDLLTHPPDGGQPQVSGTGSTTSSPPWNPAPASVLLGIHEGVRRLETSMLREAGLPARRRGGSDVNTARALQAITGLGVAVPAAGSAAAARILYRWAGQAARLPGIDEAPRWRPVRRTGGGLPPRCPYCGTYSLRVAQASGAVACFLPGCADKDGNRPYGRLDLSRMTGRPVLAWNDGLVQGAA